MGALVRLWKGGTKNDSVAAIYSHLDNEVQEPFPGNLKVWMSKMVHFRPPFPKLAKNYICYEGEY